MTQFYLARPKDKKSAIMIRVYAFGWNFRKSLGISVYTVAWEKKRSRLKMDRLEYAEINQFLSGLESKSNSLIFSYKLKRKVPTADEFQTELFREDQVVNKAPKIVSIWTEFEKFMLEKGRLISLDSLKRYRSAINILKEFNPKLKELDEKTMAEFSNYMLIQKYSPNFIQKILGVLTMFSEWSGKPLNYKGTVRAKKSDKIFLDLQELDQIKNVELPTASLQHVRDLFLFSAFTGLRYSDIVSYNDSYIQDVSGTKCIVLFSQKTGNRSIIPILPVVDEILCKYTGLPRRPSGQKFNDMLKEVCKHAGLTQDIQLTKLEGDRKRPYILKKHDAVTAHTGRRSFVTNMSMLGLTAKQISLMTGHTQQRILDIYDKTKAESNAVSVLDLIKGRV